MDAAPCVIPLADVGPQAEPRIGGKAAHLASLARAGFRIAAGFCVTVSAYEQFVADSSLQRFIPLELGRKPFGPRHRARIPRLGTIDP